MPPDPLTTSAAPLAPADDRVVPTVPMVQTDVAVFEVPDPAVGWRPLPSLARYDDAVSVAVAEACLAVGDVVRVSVRDATAADDADARHAAWHPSSDAPVPPRAATCLVWFIRARDGAVLLVQEQVESGAASRVVGLIGALRARRQTTAGLLRRLPATVRVTSQPRRARPASNA